MLTKVETGHRSAGPIDETIGENIKRMRMALGYSLQEMANKIGISYQQVQKYEKGENALRPSTILGFCAALECSIMDIFNGVDNTAPFGEGKRVTDATILWGYDEIKNPRIRHAIRGLILAAKDA